MGKCVANIEDPDHREFYFDALKLIGFLQEFATSSKRAFQNFAEKFTSIDQFLLIKATDELDAVINQYAQVYAAPNSEKGELLDIKCSNTLKLNYLIKHIFT